MAGTAYKECQLPHHLPDEVISKVPYTTKKIETNNIAEMMFTLQQSNTFGIVGSDRGLFNFMNGVKATPEEQRDLHTHQGKASRIKSNLTRDNNRKSADSEQPESNCYSYKASGRVSCSQLIQCNRIMQRATVRQCLPETQFGFRRKRRATNGLFILIERAFCEKHTFCVLCRFQKSF